MRTIENCLRICYGIEAPFAGEHTCISTCRVQEIQKIIIIKERMRKKSLKNKVSTRNSYRYADTIMALTF